MKRIDFFITGTDTGVGKTWATLALMGLLRSKGFKVAGLKPVATGAGRRDGHLVNQDALALQHAASIPLAYEQVNPFVFEPPASPHIAAELAGRPIELAGIVQTFRDLQARADGVLVEGIGGWKTPLSRRAGVAELAAALDIPVILVVGLRLGCLNHALLTHAAIRSSGVRFAGWIANHLTRDFPHAAENIRILDASLGFPPLAELSFQEDSPRPSSNPFSAREADEILRVLAPSVTFHGI